MDQDPEKITWLAGAVGGGAAMATFAFHALSKWWNPGGTKIKEVSSKLDNFVEIVQNNNEEMHSLTRATLRETARSIDECTKALIKVEGKVDEHGRKLDDHSNRIIRLEDRVPHGR